jgi:Nucleotidyltransferase domain
VDIASAVPGLLSEHPLVDAVKLTGSRATGTAHAFSDWDFEVETRNFARVAEDLPGSWRHCNHLPSSGTATPRMPASC